MPPCCRVNFIVPSAAMINLTGAGSNVLVLVVVPSQVPTTAAGGAAGVPAPMPDEKHNDIQQPIVFNYVCTSGK